MAGTVTQAIVHHTTQPRGSGKGGFKVVTFSCTGDASGGAISDTATTALITEQIKGCYLVKVQMLPGSTGPTADSDVYIKDDNGIDLLDGNGVDNLDNATDRETYAQIDGQAALQPVISALTLDVDGNSVNSATYEIKLILQAAVI